MVCAVCRSIFLLHYDHNYADIFDAIEILKCLLGIFCRVCV